MSRCGRLMAVWLLLGALFPASALEYEFPDPEIIVVPLPEAEADGGGDFFDPEPARPEESHDPFPRRAADMSEYDSIALEPYLERYDGLPLHERADLYAGQFEFMNGRPPVFSADDARAIEESRARPRASPEKKKPEKGRGRRNRNSREPAPPPQAPPEDPAPASYDALPRAMADMDEYERIAMSPYRDRYDVLPLHERAELYARQFEALRDRPPRFSPEDSEEIRASRENPVAPPDAAPPAPPSAPAPSRELPTTRYTLRPPSFFDPFPRRFADMDEYSRIAMEPFKDSYNAMPVHERADLYAAQFEYIHNRLPVFSPPDLDEIENSREMAAAKAAAAEDAADAGAEPGGGGAAGPGRKKVVSVKSKPPGRGVFDALPRRMADFPEYFREAMLQYEDVYDDLPVDEKAELYAREFETLRGRTPVFSPLTVEEIEKAEARRRPPQRRMTYEEARQKEMYKEPPRRRRKVDGVDMTAIPGPWKAERPPGNEPEEEEEDPRTIRMESLRRGWLLDRDRE